MRAFGICHCSILKPLLHSSKVLPSPYHYRHSTTSPTNAASMASKDKDDISEDSQLEAQAQAARRYITIEHHMLEGNANVVAASSPLARSLISSSPVMVKSGRCTSSKSAVSPRSSIKCAAETSK